MGYVATSHHKGFWFYPGLSLLSELCLMFSPTSQKHAVMSTGYSELPLGVHGSVNECV